MPRFKEESQSKKGPEVGHCSYSRLKRKYKSILVIFQSHCGSSPTEHAPPWNRTWVRTCYGILPDASPDLVAQSHTAESRGAESLGELVFSMRAIPSFPSEILIGLRSEWGQRESWPGNHRDLWVTWPQALSLLSPESPLKWEEWKKIGVPS